MALVGSALGQAAAKGAITMRHIVYDWQPTSTSKDPVTALASQNEGTKLAVINYDQWRPAGSLRCPCCSGSDVQDLSWADNARSTKGDGRTHTYYIASKRRKCK